MNHSRKEFLKLSGGLAAAMTLSPLMDDLFPGQHTKRLRTFGLQLYTVRDVFEKDPRGVLKQIASYGYKQIEGYERASGIFWGMTNIEFKRYMDDLGLTFISTHCDIEKDFEKKVDGAAAIGMKYLIYPSIDPPKTIDDYKRFSEKFNHCGELCKKAGIRFAYHNHDFDFKAVDGQVPQDIFMQHTDPSLVDFEMDIYWVVTAGEDPLHWLQKYPNRFKLCHIKDRVKGSTKREDTCDLGTGSIDFPTILKKLRKNGMQYFIAEQEHYPVSPLKSIEVNAEYMKKLRI
jgi:sugar phosphate isomerase/epimerase